MVCVLFRDKNFENFILSALELLGFEYRQGLAPAADTVVCCEGELESAISYYSGVEESVVYILISKKRSSHRLYDGSEADVRLLSYPFSLSSFASLIKAAQNATRSMMQSATQGTTQSITQSVNRPANSGEVEYSPDNGSVSFGGKNVRLTEREGLLFSYLFSRRGEEVSREEISSAVWGRSESSTNVTDVYISYLRKKLAPLLGQGAIRSVHGIGYILDV